MDYWVPGTGYPSQYSQLAVEHGIKFMETSAKASNNVEEVFFTLARDIKLKMDRKSDASGQSSRGGGYQLKKENTPKKSFWRCTIL